MRAPAYALTDLGAVGLAIAAAGGAWLARPVPLWIAALAIGAALVWRHPWLLIGAVALIASLLGYRAWAGMVPPEPGPIEGVATLVSDPERVSGAVRAEVRLDGRHYEAWARADGAVVLERRLAGERVAVAGSVGRDVVPDWLRARHIVGRINADVVEPRRGETALARVANVVRRTLTDGAQSIESGQRVLYTGLVIGDDRGQSVETTDDFRGAGLSHLLAVSGQNVAFVLAVTAPVTSRMGLRARLAATVAVLVLFATITRFEPSVLRATAMAALVVTATTLGRPVPAIRILALAVGGLVLIDPFLVRSVGFGLSVSASAGIVLFSAPITRVLPGRGWVAKPVGVVLAAQLGVAPLLIATFGGVPVATLPANLLAEPVAGFVMMWGASAGLLAGVLPSAVAAAIHLPTSAAIWWIATVARWLTDARLGEVGATGAGLAVAAAALAVAVRRQRVFAYLCVGLVIAVVIAPAVVIRRGSSEPQTLGDLGTLWRDTPAGVVLVVSSAATPPSALRSARRAGVAQVDVLVLPSTGSSMDAVAATLARRVEIDRVTRDAEGWSSGDG